MPAQVITNFTNNSIELANTYVTKSYAIDNYPNLFPIVTNEVGYSWGAQRFQIGPSNYSGGELADGTSDASRTAPSVNFFPKGVKQICYGLAGGTLLLTDGTARTWGINSSQLNGTFGLLGAGSSFSSTASVRSPVNVVQGSNTYIQIARGWDHNIALDANGSVYFWGPAAEGISGGAVGVSPNFFAISSPMSCASVSVPFRSIAAGVRQNHGIDFNGNIWSWGKNSYNGTLGNGLDESAFSSTASAVSVVGGGKYKAISVGGTEGGNFTENVVLALRTDGTLWAWGQNAYGELGDGTTSDRNSPVSVLGGITDWEKISAGFENCAAIRSNGTLWVWGNNDHGAVGNNTSYVMGTLIYTSPAMVAGGGTNWKQVSVVPRAVLALRTDGSLWSWGTSEYGILGGNAGVIGDSRISPVQITNWLSGGKQGFNLNSWRILATSSGAQNPTIAAILESQT
jgi:hypothetical protein